MRIKSQGDMPEREASRTVDGAASAPPRDGWENRYTAMVLQVALILGVAGFRRELGRTRIRRSSES